MPISKFIRILKISIPPLLFAAAALGLVAFQQRAEQKAAKAAAAAALARTAEDAFSPDAAMSLKFGDLVAAAQKGDLAARVEIAKRYAHGQGVGKNEARAALYFQTIVSELAYIDPRDKRGRQVAVAFRYLGQYYRSGVPKASIPANPAYAFSLLHHAATYFGDPACQYELARLILRGDGISKNSKVAAQWLLNASRKGHAPAQALLGQLLWRGEGVNRVPGDGLGLLAVARKNAAPEDKAWISRMFEAARAEASLTEILEANAFIVHEASALRFKLTNDVLISGVTSYQSAEVSATAGATQAEAPFAAGRRFLLRSPLARIEIVVKTADGAGAKAAPQSAPKPAGREEAANSAYSFEPKTDAATSVSFARNAPAVEQVSRQ
jgi:hypothetical protein